MSNIDSYIDMVLADDPTRIVHFLFQASDRFDPTTIPGLKVGAKLGTVCTGSGDKQTIDALRQCKEVYSVEASR